MIQKYLNLIRINKEKALLAGAITLSSIIFLWLTQKPAVNPKAEPTEFGVSIPAGFMVIPLDLANGSTLSMMIIQSAVIDVFNGANLVAQNLKVLKLNNEDNPAFGALVPDSEASLLQIIFAKKNLRGALKKFSNEPARFFHSKSTGTSIQTISTEE